jgi:hypothetical protein
MTYKGPSDGKLPKFVKNRSFALRKKWVALYNAAIEKYGEKRAMLVANLWLKKQVTPKKERFIKRSALHFEVHNKGFISRSRNGDNYITLVLNTVKAHKDGIEYSEAMLKDWAKQINANPIVGDVDHTFYDKVLASNMSDETVKSVLRNKKGIAKTVKAIYQKGKLWVRAVIDKRYKKLIQKSKGVSSEAFLTWEGTKATAGEVLGFTFNIKSTPAEYLAGVVA